MSGRCSATRSPTSRPGARPSGSTRFGRPEDFRDYFKANYGPTIAVYRAIADDPERTAALDAELADLARRHDLGTGSSQSTVMEWEYLLLTARKRS